MKIYKRWYFRALVAVLIIWVVVQTVFPPAQARIKQLMKSGAKAIEHENVEKIMSLLDPEFQFESGIDSESLRLALHKVFMKYSKIRVVVENMRVAVDKKRAEVYFSAWVEATIAATMTEKMPIRETGSAEEAVAVWRKTKKGWKLLELRQLGLDEEF